MWLEDLILRASEAENEGAATFLLHSHLLVSFNAVFPLQTPAPVMELVDVPDSKSGAARRGGSSPPRGTISNGLLLAARNALKLKSRKFLTRYSLLARQFSS